MRNIILVVFLSITFTVYSQIDCHAQGTTKIHPSFRALLMQYPRSNDKIIWPTVPRISASQAYGLALSGKALLFETYNARTEVYNLTYSFPIQSGAAIKPGFINQIKKYGDNYKVLF